MAAGGAAQVADAGVLWRFDRVPGQLFDVSLQYSRRQQAVSKLSARCCALWILRPLADARGARGSRSFFGGRDDLARAGRSASGASPAGLVDVSDLAVCLGDGRRRL